MRRRNFIKGIVGSTVAWPLAARAQQPAGIRRIGFILSYAEDNPNVPPRVAAFTHGLQELGWTDGAIFTSTIATAAAISTVLADMRRN